MIDYSKMFKELLVPIFRPYLANGNDDYLLIQTNKGGNAPDTVYASMLLLNVTTVGTIDEGTIDKYGQSVKQNEDIIIRINTYGDNAYSAASRLAKALEFSSMTQSLSEVGVCYRDSTAVQDISTKSQGVREERATFNITIGVADGNFVDTYNPAKEGLPSQPNYDSGIIPVEKVCLKTELNEADEKVFESTVIIET